MRSYFGCGTKKRRTWTWPAAVRGEATAQEAADAIRLASRQYAKRQLTWLRRDAQLFWLRHEKTPDMDLACRRSTQFLAGRGIE